LPRTLTEVSRVPPPSACGGRRLREPRYRRTPSNLNGEYRMYRWPRKLTALVLAVVLAAGVSCTSDNALGPSEASAPAQMTSDDQQSLLLGEIINGVKSVQLLSCSAQPNVVVTKVVGTAGGTIVVGTHRLVIPAGALARDYTIRAEQVTGRVNSVRFAPEGLLFAKPARLTLSYGNCSPLLLLKRVVYTNELLRVLELIPSLDNLNTRTVTGDIRHFSRYAVAW